MGKGDYKMGKSQLKVGYIKNHFRHTFLNQNLKNTENTCLEFKRFECSINSDIHVRYKKKSFVFSQHFIN